MKLKSIFPCFKNSEYDVSSKADEQKVSRKSGSKVLQFISATNASLIVFGAATAEYWVSPGLSYLKSNESGWTLTMDQSSWIASAFNLGGIIGCLLYPLIIDRIGRKNSLPVFLVPQVLSCAMTYFAKTFVHLFLARIIAGISYDAGNLVAIIYISEIADKNNRGCLVAFVNTLYSVGVLVIMIMGAFLSYDDMNLILLMTSFLFIFLFPLMPESPYFYLKQKREEDAMMSLSKLRGKIDSKDLQMEMESIKKTIIEGKKDKNCLSSISIKKGDRKALLIGIFLRCSSILCGSAVLIKYSQDIFEYSRIELAPGYGIIILMFSRILFGIGAAPLYDYFGRKVLLLFSSVTCSISLVFLGVFLFKVEDVDLSSISWLPVVALIIFKSSSSGIFSVGSIVICETFSIEFKTTAMAFLTIMDEVLSFLVTLGFERTVSIFGIYSVCWLYAIISFVFALVGFCIMPETKGKNFDEIQQLLMSKK